MLAVLQRTDSESLLVAGRTCGDCMLCCKVMRVPELDKHGDRMCSHAKVGKGCTIHENRPLSCRQFFCGWRFDPNLDALWRPDICRFVLWKSFRHSALLLMVDPARPLAWRRQPYHLRLQEWAARSFEKNRPIVALVGGEATVVLPDHDVPLGALASDDVIVLSRDGNGYHAERRRRQ